MNCPHCNKALVMTERQGIEIDYCPDCRGIWLDRGELDKIIERSNAFNNSYLNHNNQSHQSYDSKHYNHNYKKKSWLNELFD